MNSFSKLGLFMGFALGSTFPALALRVNDGSTVTNLVQVSNSFSGSQPDAVSHLDVVTNSASSTAGANYSVTNFATFQLAFSAPTAADSAALSNVTAHITGIVFQGTNSNNAPIQVGSTIELLTDLPLPAGDSHRLGYFAC